MIKNKIVFLLPNTASKPVGGVKVVLEYANRLMRDGCDVSIVYVAYNKWCRFTLMHLIYYSVQFLKSKISKNYLPRWFDVDHRIKQKLVWSLDRYDYPQETKIVATAIDTAYYLNKYDIKIDNKYYFIQDYENWFVDDKFVRDSYRYPMHKIVISTWLKKLVNEVGEEAILVPNGFDVNFFQLHSPIENRSKFELLAMYHTDSRKGLDVAFKAFEIVKAQYPQLHVCLFGTAPKPEYLPDWYSYYQRPDKKAFNKIYNNASIFVGASYTEGWGLTIGEAMICGCAVVCTENNGYLEMAKHCETAMLSAVGDSKALADNIIRLISDDGLRISIAKQGNQFIQAFNIESSYYKFKKAVQFL